MTSQLNLQQQQSQLEKCGKILDMIQWNRKRIFNLIADSSKELYISLHGKRYYQNKIEWHGKIQNRLICYYAKQVAILSSEPFEVAMSIREPKQSN